MMQFRKGTFKECLTNNETLPLSYPKNYNFCKPVNLNRALEQQKALNEKSSIVMMKLFAVWTAYSFQCFRAFFKFA